MRNQLGSSKRPLSVKHLKDLLFSRAQVGIGKLHANIFAQFFRIAKDLCEIFRISKIKRTLQGYTIDHMRDLLRPVDCANLQVLDLIDLWA